MVDDEELQRRLNILKQKFDDGKIVIAEHLAEGFKESFGKVRYGSDGEVDLTTVDGRVRSMAMMAAIMQDRDDTKAAASLAEIQDAYFQRITAMFQQAHHIMLENDGNPQSISWAFSRDEEHVAQNYPLIEPFVSELLEFWDVMSEPVRYHLQDLNALKGIFGGDLFPSYERNIASSVAGTIEVAAAVLGTPAWGLASVAVSQLTDAPKLKDIPKTVRNLKAEGEEISKSAAGILFKHRS